MASFMVLKGWQHQLQHMLAHDRLPFTTGKKTLGLHVLVLDSQLSAATEVGNVLMDVCRI